MRKYPAAFQLTLLIAALGASVSGCGGGGGSETGPSSQAITASSAASQFPIEATIASLATTSSSFLAHANDAAGNTYDITVTLGAGPDKVNNLIYPSARKTYVQSTLLKKNGVTTSTSSAEVYFSLAPFLIWGSVNGNNNVMQVKQQTQLPTNSKTGTTGAIYSGSNYLGGSALFPDAQSTTWSLEADTATTAWLCLNISNTPAIAVSASSTSIESDCFRINEAGVVSGFKADFSQFGVSLRFK